LTVVVARTREHQTCYINATSEVSAFY